MAWYFFSMTGKSKWQRHLAEQREQVMRDLEPEFVTILDVNHPCDDDTIPDNLFYRGDLYFDWDGKDSLDDLLDDVRRFISKLEDWGLDLNQTSWWLSGKKGVHATIPMECLFDAKMIQTGVKDLFRIYGRFAWENSTTYMDMRVYSGRKGRMWRTTCRSREVDGRTTWKTPITAEQIKVLTEDGYWEWCSEKRPPIPKAEPTLNLQLSTEMQVLQSRIQEDNKKRSKVKANVKIFESWGDEKPPTIQAAFAGQNVDMGRDLNDIGLQFATAAIALGLNTADHTDEFLNLCSGFIQERSKLSGTAHRTESSIKERLKQSFHYCLGNPSYVYLPESFASVLLKTEQHNADIRGVKVGASEEKQLEISQKLQNNLWVDESAVYQDTKEETKPILDYSWKKGSLQTVRDPDGKITHYSVVPMVKGKEHQRTIIPVSTLLSNKDFSAHVASYGGTAIIHSGAQLAATKKALLNFVDEEEESTDLVTTSMEGIHFIPTTDPEEGDYQGAMYWVQPDKTTKSPKYYNDEPEPHYLDVNNPQGQYGTDLSEAYALDSLKTENRELIHHLLELNGDHYSLALMLAWFTACTIKHPLYVLKRIKNFPILQIVGQAGCGKTTTANLLLHLFTWRKDFRINIAGRNLTPYALSSLASATTSLPLVIDEVKPQNLGAQYMADFRGFIQVIYTLGSEAKRGGGDGSNSTSFKAISKDQLLAPVCFLAEALEASQASILERSVVAAFHKDAVYGRSKHQRYLSQNERNIGMLGWAIVQHLMSCDLKHLVEIHDQTYVEAEQFLVSGNNHRVIENAAMMLTGFDFFTEVIEKHYPNEFSSKLTALRASLTNADKWLTKVASEVVRFLAVLAMASYEDRDGRLSCKRGLHYEFEDGETEDGRVSFILLNIQQAFYLYRERMKAAGLSAAFSSSEELTFTLGNSAVVVDTLDYPKLNGVCVKINPIALAKEGVQMFKQ